MEDKGKGQGGGRRERALIHLNPETLRTLLEVMKTKEVDTLPLKAFKLSFTKSSPLIMSFGEFGRAVREVLALAEGGVVEEMIVGDLDASSKGHQTMVLRQIFATCPDLKKCVDLDGKTLPAFDKYKQQCQIYDNKGRIDLIPEENLEMKDLASCRLVDKAWSNTATSLFEKDSFVDVCKAFVHRSRREKKRKEVEDTSIGFKHFKIIKDPSYSGIPFSEFAANVLAGLKNKVKGGGKDVEGLTISTLQGTPKEEWDFLASLFAICSNVKKLEFQANFDECRPGDSVEITLPLLDQVKTLVWSCWGPSSLIAPATPNVEVLVDMIEDTVAWTRTERAFHYGTPINGGTLCSLEKEGYWPLLKSLRDMCLLTTVPPVRPLVQISLFVQGALNLSHILPLMENYARTLEVLQLEEPTHTWCYYYDFSPGPRYQGRGPFPRMPKLRRLRLINAYPRQLDVEGFIFGDKLRPANVQNPLRLETHFPGLKTFEFTVAQRRNLPDYQGPGRRYTNLDTCINFLNFFPFLLEDDLDQGPTFPSVRKLTLNWIDPEEDFEAWKVWTRRVVAKFPNVKGNPHVDKWNGLAGNVKEDKTEEERILAEWKMLEGRV